MSDSKKLLRAFIKASGYEVEEVVKIERCPRIDGPHSWIEDIEHVDYKVTKKTYIKQDNYLYTIGLSTIEVDYVGDKFPFNRMDPND